MSLLCDLPGWSLLLLATGKTGITTKLRLCAGCHNPFFKQHSADLACTFNQPGFVLPNSTVLRACGTVHCSKCFHAGPPFKTRRENQKGLVFPKVNARLFPNFICKAYEVRAHLGRELLRHQHDFSLLMLERMRQLDTMNEWAEGTLSSNMDTRSNAFSILRPCSV